VLLVLVLAPKAEAPPKTFLFAFAALGEAPRPLKKPPPDVADDAAAPPKRLPPPEDDPKTELELVVAGVDPKTDPCWAPPVDAAPNAGLLPKTELDWPPNALGVDED
jgi:hypothetical protein